MAKKLTKRERWERYLESAELLESFVEGMKVRGTIDNPRMVNKFCGLVAEELHRVPVTHTGFVSKKAHKAKKKTPDHYFGRKVSGELIYQMIMRGCSIKRIAMIIWSRSRVNYVTSAENTRLKKFDGKNPNKTWREVLNEYAAAGIQLIHPDEILIYNICGIEYSKKTAKIEFGIDQKELNKRINSRTKKWSQWQKIENQ